MVKGYGPGKFAHDRQRRKVMLEVHRKGYHRKGYYATRNGKTYYVPPTHVPPSTYLIKDRGAPGRGEDVIGELNEGKMNRVAQSMGYDRVSDIPKSKRDEYADRLVKKYGAKRAFGMAHAQVIFRKRTNDGHKQVFLDIRNHIGKQLAPKRRKHD